MDINLIAKRAFDIALALGQKGHGDKDPACSSMITMQKSNPMQPTHLSCSQGKYMNRTDIHLPTAETFSSVGHSAAPESHSLSRWFESATTMNSSQAFHS